MLPLAVVELVIVGLLPVVCPVPERLITSDEGVPFVASVIVPLAAPAAEGLNVTLNAVLAPAAIVVEVLSPVWLNPAPATATCEKVSVVFPLFFNVIGWEFVLPVVTVPNATLDGVAAICACIPVPLSAIVAGETGALLVMEILPVALPEVVGANVAVNVAFAPALIDIGCNVIV